MNWEAVGAVGELVGGMVVILSLLYLAAQIRQNTALARAAAQRQIYDAYQQNLDRVYRDSDVFRLALENFASIPKRDQVAFHLCMAPFVNHLDQVLRMYRMGLETEDNVTIYGDVCLAALVEPGGRTWWEITKPLFVREAREYLDRRLSEPTTLPPPLSESLPFYKPDAACPAKQTPP